MASTSHRKPGHGRCLDKNRIRVITNLQKQPSLAAKIARIVSYSSPSLIAELREWQKAAYHLACVDTAISYFSTATPPGEDALTDHVCDTMFAAISRLYRCGEDALCPAVLRPGDRERAMGDCRVFYDDPLMQALIASLDEPSRLLLQAAADREREQLPLYPAHLIDADCGEGNSYVSSLPEPDCKADPEKWAGFREM